MTEKIRAITSTHGYGVLASTFPKQDSEKDQRRREEKPNAPYGQQVIEDQVDTSHGNGDAPKPLTPSAYGPHYGHKPMASLTGMPDNEALWSPLPMPPTTLSVDNAPSARG